MRAGLRELLDALHRDGRAFDAAQADRLRRRRNLDPDSAALLRLLALALGARRIVELGTSNGYSTLWLADAARATGGHVVSVDADGAALELARANLASAGLASQATLRHGDAGELLRETDDGSVDLLFVDAERSEYAGWWPQPIRVLAPRGLLAVDNVLSHAGEVAGLRALIDADESLCSVVVPSGAGLLLVTREG